MKHDVYLGLGSNVGDRGKNLEDAVRSISSIDGVDFKAASDIYETEPIGYVDQSFFLNMVVLVSTDVEPLMLLKKLQDIEKELKRVRTVRWGPRTIDIDILLYGDIHMDTDDLKLPHPRMFERLFVLAPLRNVFKGEYICGHKISRLIERCEMQEIRLYKQQKLL